MRRAVAQVTDALGCPPDVAEALAMATAELLENAMKYGAHPSGQPSIDYELRREGDRFVITVTNPVSAESALHLSRLHDRIARLRASDDAGALYAELLADVYSGDAAEAASTGLGIVRIAFEGGFAVECDDGTPGVVRVIARREVGA